MMESPSPDRLADGFQRFRASRRQEAGERMPPSSRRFPCSEFESEKVKRLFRRKIVPPVCILAVDDLRLLRMQNQLADRKAVGKRVKSLPIVTPFRVQ